MEEIVFLLFSVFGAALFYFLCYILGKKIGKWIGKEDFIIRSPLGVGFGAVILFFLGIFHLYTKTVLLATGIIIALVCWREIKEIVTGISLKKLKIRTEKNTFYTILKYSLFFFLIVLFFVSLSPETEWDSLSFHLAVAKVYVREQGIIPIEYSYHAALPHLFDVIYVVGETWKSDVFSRVFVFLWNSTLVFALWKWGRRLFSENVGFLAALFFISTPVIMIYFPATYIDVPVALFCLAAAWALWSWKETNEKAWLWIMAFELGLAVSTKLTTIPFALACGLYMLWCMIKKDEKSKNIVTYAIRVGAVLFLFLLPWGIFNGYHFNNPVYPFGEGIFHGKYWNSDVATWWQHARDNYSTGQTLSGYFLIPIALTFLPHLSGPIYGLSPFYFLFIPVLFLYFHTKKQRESLYFLVFLLFIALTGWFFMGPDMRYMLYLLPLFGVLAAYGIECILNDETLKQWMKNGVKGVCLIILISNLVLFFVIFRNDVSLWAGKITREEYKALDTPNYWVSQWINENTALDAKIFFANNDRAYYLEREYLTGFGIFSAYIDYPALDEDLLYTRLKEIGVTHVMVETKDDTVILLYEGYDDEHTIAILTGLVDKYGTLVYDENGFKVYEIE